MKCYEPWGRYPRTNQPGIELDRHETLIPIPEGGSVLPFGNGRSYGDSCLNEPGLVLSTRRLDRFISFDKGEGRIRCEAGVLLSEILEVIVRQGWFLPVTPGTKFVTVGGAIANDVHGKNHHRTGTFGRHVHSFELLRSDGERIVCSKEQNSALFAATIGGLGLTGLITWAELELMVVPGRAVEVETIKFDHIDRFFELSEESDATHEYTVAWVDCSQAGAKLGRGIYTRANHSDQPVSGPSSLKVTVPVTPPLSLIRPWTVKVFNTFYYERIRRPFSRAITHYDPFLYPLDSLLEWNRIYGRKGFLQYQFVLPYRESVDGVRDILQHIARSQLGSSLAVLKICGDVASPGVMSFPMHGVSLALDFPFIENKTLPLFKVLDEMVRSRGGRLYPAKDAHMDGRLFREFYPAFAEVEKHRDPAFMSDMWRRVIRDTSAAADVSRGES